MTPEVWTLLILLCRDTSGCSFNDQQFPTRQECVAEMARLELANEKAFRHRTICIPGEVVGDWRAALGVEED